MGRMEITTSFSMQFNELHLSLLVNFDQSLITGIQLDTVVKQSKKKPQRLVVMINKLTHDGSEDALRWVTKLRITNKLELLLWPGIRDQIMRELGMQNVPTMVFVKILRSIAVEYGLLDPDKLIDNVWVVRVGDITTDKITWEKTITDGVDPVPNKLN